MTTPAEELRAAAKLMRERAQTQPETAWLVVPPEPPPPGVVPGGLAKIVTEDVPEWVVARTLPDAAPHIAGMHPLVALAVAEWLETEAHMQDHRGNSVEGQTFHALKVAHAYLGTECSIRAVVGDDFYDCSLPRGHKEPHSWEYPNLYPQPRAQESTEGEG